MIKLLNEDPLTGDSFWDTVQKRLLESPFWVAVLANYVMGYGVAYLLSNYYKKLESDLIKWPRIHHFFGLCYSAIVFLITNIRLILKVINDECLITFDDFLLNIPKVMLFGFVGLALVTIIVFYDQYRRDD